MFPTCRSWVFSDVSRNCRQDNCHGASGKLSSGQIGRIRGCVSARSACPGRCAMEMAPGLTAVSLYDTIKDRMNQKHQGTLEAIFVDPVRSNIPWRDIENI